MKALLRNPGETILEKDFASLEIDDAMMRRMTSVNWCGGPYVLVDGYEIKDIDEDMVVDDLDGDEETVEEKQEEKFEFNGKMYTARELKELLGSL